MTKKGFILVELLAAAVIFGLASAGIYSAFEQGLKAEKRIRQSFADYDPARIFFLRLERDLRNTAKLRDYPFRGKNAEIAFPVFSRGKFFLIRYVLKKDELIRYEEEITQKLKKGPSGERALLRNLKSFEFKFPFEDADLNRSLEPFWLDEPYMGIPRGVKVEISLNQPGLLGGLSFIKTVSIPQGKFGHAQNK